MLANEEGKRITPSAVWVGAGGAVEVGAKALRRRTLEPDRVVTSVKRLMGRRWEEVADEPGVTRGADGGVKVLGERQVGDVR